MYILLTPGTERDTDTNIAIFADREELLAELEDAEGEYAGLEFLSAIPGATKAQNYPTWENEKQALLIHVDGFVVPKAQQVVTKYELPEDLPPF